MPQYISIKGLFSSKKNDLTPHWYNYRTRCNLSRVCEHGYNKIKRKPTHIYKKCLENFPLLIHFKLNFGSRIFSVMSILWWEYKIGCIKIIPSSLSRIILAEARPLNLLVSIQYLSLPKKTQHTKCHLQHPRAIQLESAFHLNLSSTDEQNCRSTYAQLRIRHNR